MADYNQLLVNKFHVHRVDNCMLCLTSSVSDPCSFTYKRNHLTYHLSFIPCNGFLLLLCNGAILFICRLVMSGNPVLPIEQVHITAINMTRELIQEITTLPTHAVKECVSLYPYLNSCCSHLDLRFTSISSSKTVCRTPWTRDQPLARPLPNTNTE
jgi:hypothetical protein